MIMQHLWRSGTHSSQEYVLTMGCMRRHANSCDIATIHAGYPHPHSHPYPYPPVTRTRGDGYGYGYGSPSKCDGWTRATP